MSLSNLYPFLYGGPVGRDDCLAECRQSSEAKIQEVTELRVGLASLAAPLARCAAAMAERLQAGGQLLVFGNGGSCTDAQAVAALFSARFPTLALIHEVAVITALANDVGFQLAFSRQVAAFGGPGDIALGISTSGNSENVLRAFAEAGQRGLLRVGLAGATGGQMVTAGLEHLLIVPSSAVPRIQEGQTTLYHLLWQLVQSASER